MNNYILENINPIELEKFPDNRGIFYNIGLFEAISISHKNVIRGLHFQNPRQQEKIVTVVRGKIFDVIIDIRKNSNTFGYIKTMILEEKSYCQVHIPKGFAHGFAVLSKEAIISYKCNEIFDMTNSHTILWNDSDLNISWPIKNPILSIKDSNALKLKDFSIDNLPIY